MTDSAQLSTHYLRGSLFENLIIAEYLKRKHHDGRPPGCYFWRDKSGNEIDLLIDDKGKLTAIEIKSGTTIRDAFFKNLIRFQKFSGITQEDCCLVYGGETDMPRKNAQVCGWKTFSKFQINC